MKKYGQLFMVNWHWQTVYGQLFMVNRLWSAVYGQPFMVNRLWPAVYGQFRPLILVFRTVNGSVNR